MVCRTDSLQGSNFDGVCWVKIVPAGASSSFELVNHDNEMIFDELMEFLMRQYPLMVPALSEHRLLLSMLLLPLKWGVQRALDEIHCLNRGQQDQSIQRIYIQGIP